MKWILIIMIFGGPESGNHSMHVEFNNEEACLEAANDWSGVTVGYDSGNKVSRMGHARVMAKCYSKGVY